MERKRRRMSIHVGQGDPGLLAGGTTGEVIKVFANEGGC